MVIMTVAVMIRFDFCAGDFFLWQQSGFETEFAQRVFDFFDRGFAFGQRKVQPFACNGNLDVGNARQAGKRGFDFRRAAAAIHAANGEGQWLPVFALDVYACRNIHGFRS